MKQSYILSLCCVIIISIICLYAFFLTKHQKEDNNLIHIDINIVPNQSTYNIHLLATGTQQNNTIMWKSDIQSNNNEWNRLWNTQTTLSYLIGTNTISEFIINSMSGSNFLPSAYIIFIDDIVIPQLWNNLALSWTLQQLWAHHTKNLFTTQYSWISTGTDNLWTRQKVSLSVKLYCSPLYYLWFRSSCSLEWTITITTPLTSGPIWAKIQGQFSTSHLQ